MLCTRDGINSIIYLYCESRGDRQMKKIVQFMVQIEVDDDDNFDPQLFLEKIEDLVGQNNYDLYDSDYEDID